MTKSLDEQFKKVFEDVQKLKGKPTQFELIEIYALYKQATEGDCNVQPPRSYEYKNRAKWDAWVGKRGLPKEEAKQMYVDAALNLISYYGIKEDTTSAKL